MQSEHKTISMVSENIKIHVRKDFIDVDCNFVFRNKGKACRVKMGFPDVPWDGDGDDIYPLFFFYDSYVNGNKVPCAIEKDFEEQVIWHTKEVDFAPNSEVSVRDIYTVPAGLAPTSNDSMRRTFCYFLFTGASWEGKIQSVQIDIDFDKGVIDLPFRLKALGAQDNSGQLNNDSHTVEYETNLVPECREDRISFFAKDLEPSRDDTVVMTYGKTMDKAQTLGYFKKFVESYLSNFRTILNNKDRKPFEEALRTIKEEAREFNRKTICPLDPRLPKDRSNNL